MIFSSSSFLFFTREKSLGVTAQLEFLTGHLVTHTHNLFYTLMHKTKKKLTRELTTYDYFFLSHTKFHLVDGSKKKK